MTLATTPPVADYLEDAVTLLHPIPFQFQLATDIHCSRIVAGVETVLTQGADFTVAGGAGGTGTVTKMSAGVVGTIFRVKRVTTRAQTTDYTPGDPFPAEVHEAALDHAAAVDQEQDVQISDVESRALRLSVGEVAAAFTPAVRRGMVLTFADDAAAAPALLPKGSFPSGPPGSLSNAGLQFRTPQQKGALADNATSDTPAFSALVADAKAAGVAGYNYKGNLGYGYGTAGGLVYVPNTPNAYYIAAAIDVDVTLYWKGEGVGRSGGLSSVIRVGPNTAGFRVQFFDTTNYIDRIVPPAGPPIGGQGTTFDGLTMLGPGFNGTTRLDDPRYSAFFARAGSSYRNLNIFGFQGDGIHIHAGVGLPEGGGANCWEVSYVWVEGVLNGLFTDASDTNAGICTLLQCSAARDWAINDSSGAANLYLAPLAQLCGMAGAGTAANPSRAVTFGGQHYICFAGQEAGASVNPPTGTTSDNAFWMWFETGGVVTGIVAWFNGIIVRAAGSYRLANGGMILNGYFEGNQPPPQHGSSGGMIGGTWGGNLRPRGGGYINFSANQVFMNDLRIERGSLEIGNDIGGSILLGRSSPGNPSIVRANAAATYFALCAPDASQNVNIYNAEVHLLQFSGGGYFANTTNFAPLADNANDLGRVDKRWNDIFATNNVIQTSDEQLKEQVRDLTSDNFNALLDAVMAVPLVAFKLTEAVALKGDKARDHYGAIAQEVARQMEKRGLDPFLGGFLGKDPMFEEVDEDHEIEQEATRVEVTYHDEFEIVDDGSGPRAVLRRVPVERPAPDLVEVPVHDELGKPVIIPARPPHKRFVLIDDELVEREFPGIPERQMTHRVPRMERVTVTRKVQRPLLDDNGDQVWRWNMRYGEFQILRTAGIERELRRGAAAKKPAK